MSARSWLVMATLAWGCAQEPTGDAGPSSDARGIDDAPWDGGETTGADSATSRADAVTVNDAGLQDAGLQDAGLQDGGLQDGGLQDGGPQDGGLQDGGPPDARPADAATAPDAAGIDASALDAAGLPDASGAPDTAPADARTAVDAAPADAEPAPVTCSEPGLTTWTIDESAASGTPDTYFFDVSPGDPFCAEITGGGGGTWGVTVSNGLSSGVYCRDVPSCAIRVPDGQTTLLVTAITSDIGFYTLRVRYRPR